MSALHAPRHRRSTSAGGGLPRFTTSRRTRRWLVVVLLVLAAAAYVVVQIARPVPKVTASAVTDAATLPGNPGGVAWPSQGQAAVGIAGVGVVGTHGAQTPTPLASITKVMTAYVVLHDHPLGATATGPNIGISETDVATYEHDLAAGDSVVAVEAGEQLSELQALQALLIPSGDNIATVLADWDAGSEPAFVAKMNTVAKQLGLTHTHYADASGVTPGSKSTAADQVRLAALAMQVPAFKATVAMPQVTLPVAGVQYNVDSQLGKGGVVGIKTGYTGSAGGCFLFAANAPVSGTTRTIIGAVLHQTATATQPSAITAAFDASRALLTSVAPALEQTVAVHAGATLGQLDVPWTTPVALQASRSVTLTGLPGEQVRTRVVLPNKVSTPVAAHQRLGTAVVSLGSETVRVPLRTSGAIPAASLSWRLTNI